MKKKKTSMKKCKHKKKIFLEILLLKILLLEVCSQEILVNYCTKLERVKNSVDWLVLF